MARDMKEIAQKIAAIRGTVTRLLKNIYRKLGPCPHTHAVIIAYGNSHFPWL